MGIRCGTHVYVDGTGRGGVVVCRDKARGQYAIRSTANDTHGQVFRAAALYVRRMYPRRGTR